MSATLYALVILQGTTLTFEPGYPTAAECTQQYKGGYVSCFAYDPNLSTWTAFFKLPEGGFRTVGKIVSEDECTRYIGAFKDGIPTACRQLAMPVTCNVACVAPMPPPPPAPPPKPPEVTPPPVPPEPKPDPASLETKPNDVQVGGKSYAKVAGLTWVEREDFSLMFRWGRTTFRAKMPLGRNAIVQPPCRLRCRLRKRHKGGMSQCSMRNTLSH